MSRRRIHKLLPLTTVLTLLLAALFASAGPAWGAGPVCSVNPGGGGDYTTIGAALADVGCTTINVAAGTYPETVNISRSNVVLQSVSGAATTIITPPDTTAGGIYITGDGNTVRGFTVRDYTNNASENKIVRIHNDADNNVIEDNVLQGNLNQPSITDQTEYGILVYGSGNTIDMNEVYDIGYTGINVVGQPHSDAANNTISGNNVHHIGIYGITIDRSPDNTIAGNTISNLVGGTLWGDPYDPAVWCWGIVIWGQAADGNDVLDQHLIGLPNGMVLSSAHNTYVNGCNITGNDGIGLRISWSSWAGGIPVGNLVEGNNISNNGNEGARIDPGSGSIGTGNEFHCNAIQGNTNYGMRNLSTVTIDAENNWWGDNSGPTHSSNPAGTGDVVTDYVDFDPWLLQDCLGFTKSVSPANVSVGEEATFTIEVTNNCVCTLVDALVRDEVPAGLTVLAVSTTRGTAWSQGQTVMADIGALDPGQGATITIKVRVDQAGSFTNLAYLTSLMPELEAQTELVVLAGTEFVPEPGSVVLLASGLMGLAGYATLHWRSRD